MVVKQCILTAPLQTVTTSAFTKAGEMFKIRS